MKYVIILAIAIICAFGSIAFGASGDKTSSVVKFHTISSSTKRACVKGELRVDASYLYSCYSSNKWKRVGSGSTF